MRPSASNTAPETRDAGIEWPTLALILGCYAAWALATTVVAALWLPAAVCLAAVCIALHGSLCHEVLHGHPTRDARVNEGLVFPAIGLLIPYRRFRDTHLAHHRDSRLTDPYDDPETNFFAPEVWSRLPAPVRVVLGVNNTLAGRMVLGPVVAQTLFLRDEFRRLRTGDRARVLQAWGLHIPAVSVVLLWLLLVSAMPVWAYLVAVYGGLSILKIRTYLEHRAHPLSRARTVIVEDRGVLAFLFLNNNLHAVHHRHPTVAWYRLPGIYSAAAAEYLQGNGGYRYPSYGAIFRAHFLQAKDPVPHPLVAAPDALASKGPDFAPQPVTRRTDA